MLYSSIVCHHRQFWLIFSPSTDRVTFLQIDFVQKDSSQVRK